MPAPGPALHVARQEPRPRATRGPSASQQDQARLPQQPTAPAPLPRQDVDEHDLSVSQRLTWANYRRKTRILRFQQTEARNKFGTHRASSVLHPAVTNGSSWTPSTLRAPTIARAAPAPEEQGGQGPAPRPSAGTQEPHSPAGPFRGYPGRQPHPSPSAALPPPRRAARLSAGPTPTVLQAAEGLGLPRRRAQHPPPSAYPAGRRLPQPRIPRCFPAGRRRRFPLLPSSHFLFPHGGAAPGGRWPPAPPRPASRALP